MEHFFLVEETRIPDLNLKASKSTKSYTVVVHVRAAFSFSEASLVHKNVTLCTVTVHVQYVTEKALEIGGFKLYIQSF